MSDPRGGIAPAEDAPFVLLQVTEKAERRDRILGAVLPLKNYARPFDDYRPWIKSKKLSADDIAALNKLKEKLWEGEAEETVNLTDVLTGKRGVKTDLAKVKVSELFNAHAKNATGAANVKIQAGKAQHFMCDNVEASLEEYLLDSPQWKSQVLQLWNKYLHEDNPQFLLVTGVYTCSDITVSWSKSVEKELRIQAALPVSEIAGSPDPVVARKLDLGFEIVHEKSTETEVFAKCADNLIFALAYKEIEFEVEESEQPEHTGPRWYNLKKYLPSKSTKLSKRTPKRPKATAIKTAWLGDPYYGLGIDPGAEGDSSETDKPDGPHIVAVKPHYKKIEDAVAALSNPQTHHNGSLPRNGLATNGTTYSRNSAQTNGSPRIGS